MNKILIVLMFIFLGTSILIVSSMGKEVENSFIIEYHNNKNLALPDLTGSVAIEPNLFRLLQNGSQTLDYNIYNGNYISNTTGGLSFASLLFNVETGKEYTLSSIYISGSTVGPHRVLINGTYHTLDIRFNQTITFIPTSSTIIVFGYSSSKIDNNFTFKLQLEKGSQSTSYVVPKLIPIYKDNLTQQEKQEIGFGAFGGLSQIIRSVDNVIKPIRNFINGVLNLFK